MKNNDASEFLSIMRQLMSDQNFLTLTEYGKTRHWIQDLNLSENNFSDILTWLLDPNEGHGLVDFFIKRLISAVHITACEETDSTCMSKYKSRITDQVWLDLDEIMLCNLGSSIVAREVVVPKTKKRIDILIVDPKNEIVIVVERKDGSSVHSDQLRHYQNFIEKSYSNYYQLFVLSDSHELDHQLGSTDLSWIQIGDSWLIDALKEAVLPGRVDITMQSRLQTLLCLMEENVIDGDSFFKNIEGAMDDFCQNNRENISKLSNNSFLNIDSRTLLSKHSQYLNDPNDNWEITKAHILAVKYNVLLTSMVEWGIFEVLKGQLKTMYPQERFVFDERKKEMYFSTQHIDELCEEFNCDQWPLHIGLIFPDFEKNENGMEVNLLPKVEFCLDSKFLTHNTTSDTIERLCEKYSLTRKRRWARKEHSFTSEEQVYNSQNIMKLWVREMIELADIISKK